MTEVQITELLSALNAAEIPAFRDYPLAPETSFRIGGPADIAVKPETEAQLATAVFLLKKQNIPFYPVGKASNLLFDDAGFRGAVLFCGGLKGLSVQGNTLTAACGETLTGTAAHACEAGLSGLEFAFGIPGSVGGGVCMNAGAYGGEIAAVLESCRLLDTGTLEIAEKTNEEMRFSYRHSLVSDRPEYLVLSAVFRLSAGDKAQIRAQMDDLMRRRREKQPLEYPSAGSVFKRPAPDVYMGRLIEEAGLKGTSIGGAAVSPKHAGFIVNTGNAAAADVRALVRLVQDRIRERNGFVPECEIKWIPAEPTEKNE